MMLLRTYVHIDKQYILYIRFTYVMLLLPANDAETIGNEATTSAYI